MDRVEILGVQIDNVSWDEALERIRGWIRSGEPHQIVTPAIEQVVLARRDAGFRQVLENAELVVADGMPLVFASHWHKTPLKARITGVDLVPAICRLTAEEGGSVFFLGGEEGVADEAAKKLQESVPGLNVAGTYCPPFGFESMPGEEERALQAIQSASPDALFVALGCPRQEKWIHRHRKRLGVSVAVGIGGAFNMIAGREKRAPQWLQEWGLEAIYRLFQRPGVIWRRVAVNAPHFFFHLIDLFTYRAQKRFARWARPLFLAAMDALVAPLMFLFSYWLYFRSGVFSNAADPFADHPSLLNMPAYSDLMIAVSLLAVFSFWFFRLYERNKYLTSRELLARVCKASLAIVFLLIGLQFLFFKSFFQQYNFRGFSRVVFGLFGVFSTFVFVGWRWLFAGLEKAMHRYGVNLDRIILAGRLEIAERVALSLNEHPEWGNYPLGVVCQEDEEEWEESRAIPRLGTIADLRRLLPARKVDEILIADPDLPMNHLLEIVRSCRDFRVRLSIIPSIHELLGARSEIKQMGDYRVITVSIGEPILKRE